MKPVDQRYTQKAAIPMGDCLAACIASIFELDLEEVPHFVQMVYERGGGREGLTSALISWASDFGVSVNNTNYKRARRAPEHWHPGYWIAAVRSSYGKDVRHAVVMFGHEVKHDPNPVSRQHHAKHEYRFWGETWFELYNPASLVRQMDWRVLRDLMAFAS